MASRSKLLLSFALAVFLWPPFARADTLKITSTPAGASVEINGVTVGTTPYEEQVPGGYFHKTKTALGRRLQHSMVARISLTGYTTKEVQMTEGPMRPAISTLISIRSPKSSLARSPRKSRKLRKRRAKPTSPQSRRWRR